MALKIKTYENRLVVKPDAPNTEILGTSVSEEEVGGSICGEVVAVGDNITDVKVGEKIHYSKKTQEILIEDDNYHIVWYDHVYYSLEESQTQK